MTSGLRKGPTLAPPQSVAHRIYREMEEGTAEVIYVPRYWRLIMFAVRSIPERVAKKLNF